MNQSIKFILLLLLLSSCVSRIEKKGYAIESSDYQLLQEGVTSKESVLEIMGSPTIVSDLTNKESWLYYSEEVKKFLFYFPEVTSRNILVINFDTTNTIKTVKEYNLDNEQDNVKFISKYTVIKGHEKKLFKALLGNIGQVKAAQ